MLDLTRITLFSILVTVVIAFPSKDVQIVESTIREVRAAVPDLQPAETNYDHHYNNDDEDSIGYLKKSEDSGSDGYKHYDSYHKKDGDKYGYEKHSSFGKADGADYDSGSDGGKSSYKVSEDLSDDDHGEGYESAGKYTDGHYEGGHYGNHGDYESDGESAKYTAGDHESLEEAEDDY